MGRQRKVEVEAPAAEPLAKKPTVKTVDAVHTIKYSEPVTVPVAESEPDEADGLEIEQAEFEEGEEEAKPRPLSPRARLREKLAKLGVTNQALKLRIDRLPQYEINGQSGINAEKDYIRTTACTEAFFDTDDYLEHLRSFGPGTYWLTLRGGKSIVAQWQERIGGAPQAAPSAENPTAEAYQPTAAVDPLDSLLKQAEKFTKLRKLLVPESEAPRSVANNEPQTTEQALLTLMNTDNALVETIAGKLGKMFRGNGSGSAGPELGWIDVIFEAIKQDTLPKLINTFATQLRPATATVANGEAPAQQPQPVEQQMTPDVAAYQRLIQVLLGSMRVNGDVTPVLQVIDGFVGLFPEHAATVESFMNAPAEMVLPGLAQSSPMAAEVTQLPHAAEWICKLKAAYFEDSEEPKDEET